MAVIKHISVKGSKGADALNYVLYKHNEMTGEILLDVRGNPIMRDEYYLDGINCEPYSFDAECKEVNDLYGKNQLPGDIKAHHFIVSYDPKDGVDHGLTGPKAQQLSMEWAERCLPGFQILVCTHMDGSNESGNIHTHIMMNSVRKYDTKPEMYGERDIDHKAGYKLHLTDDYLRYMKQELMNICEREELNQIDLVSPAKNKITDKEYHVLQNGQSNLEKQHIIDGSETEKTLFQTQKHFLREAVIDVAQRATSYDEFCIIMRQMYNIQVKESRGRISYLHPDRGKYITGRALGTLYEKESIIQIVNEEKATNVQDRYTLNNTNSFSADTVEDCIKLFEMHTDLRLVVSLQDSAKARISASYVNAVTLTNVKSMAETILFVQQNGFDTLDDLKWEYFNSVNTTNHINDEITQRRAELENINEDIHFLGQYLASKRVLSGFIEKQNDKTSYEKHEKDFEIYRNAIGGLNKKYNNMPFPNMNELKKTKKCLNERIEMLKKQRQDAVNRQHTLKIALKNINSIFSDKVGEKGQPLR